MKKNMGSTDRIIRLIIGLVVIAAGLVFKSWWGLIGVVLVITALTSFCPLYLPFKINTAKKE
ncbi:DUF2892 domain-containing protein [candidate division KSB1 bacterium]|nr:DUF2892 domain-containing protein [candidate division KSB1 bacterium]RQW01287.1 MAG: DUF2892 domain-containing protein [candidate division KSB1 bacterium]